YSIFLFYTLSLELVTRPTPPRSTLFPYTTLFRSYVMLETGQPLHFYDADTLNGKIEVRMATEGEKLYTLDGKERTLSSEDIVISDRKSTRLNSSHVSISYAVFCLKKKK